MGRAATLRRDKRRMVFVDEYKTPELKRFIKEAKGLAGMALPPPRLCSMQGYATTARRGTDSAHDVGVTATFHFRR